MGQFDVGHYPDIQYTQDFSGCLFGHNPIFKHRLLFMLEAYWDESGTQDDTLLILSGYLSQSSQWGIFTEQWRATLNKFNIPYFHMKDFRNGNSKLFRDLSEAKKQELFVRLHKIINDNTLRGFTLSIHSDDFNKITDREFKNTYGTVYTFCTQQCVQVVHEWAISNKYHEPIAYIYDSGHKHMGQASKEFKEIMDDDIVRKKHGVQAFSFANDKDVLPLQSADMLAYECYHKHRNRHLDANGPTDILLQEPGITQKKITWAHYDKEFITKLFEESRNPKR